MTRIQKMAKFTKRESIYGSMSFFLPVSLNFFLINTIWTPTQGWYLEWANYIKQGLNPYTDFYLPFPPLFVWVNRIFLWTSDPLIAERFFMTLAYSLMSLGLYKLLARFFSSNIAICTSLLSILVFQLSPTNTISGYYEFAILLATWGLYFSFSEGSAKRFFGGILLVASSLTKQNFLPLILAIVLMEFFTFQNKKKFELKKYATTFGACCAFLVFTGYLIATESFLRFIEIMLQGGGKNPKVLPLLKNILVPSLNPSILYLFCLILIILIMLKDRDRIAENVRTLVNYFLATQMFLIMLSPFSISSLIERRVSVIIFIIIFLAILSNWKFLNQSTFVSKSWAVVVMIFLTPFFVFVMNEIFLRTILNKNGIFHSLTAYSSNVGSNITGLFLLAMNTCILFQLIAIRYPKLKIYFYRCLKDEVDQPRLLAKLNYVVIGLLGAGLLNAVNGGFEFPANLILGSISIAFFVKHFEQVLKKNFFVISFALSMFLSSIQIGIYNYQWFGWNEIASGHSTSDRSEVSVFRDFFLTGPQKNFYQEVKLGIDLAEKKIAKSTGSDPKVLIFPMQPVIYELSSFSNYRLNCPIMHFDVCPDNEADKNFEKIKRNPPDLVVLFDSGMSYIYSNEKAWRDGKISTYRKIQEFLLESGRYSTIKIVASNSVNLSDVYIMVLKAGRD